MKSKIKIVTLFAPLFFASTCLANLFELEIFERKTTRKTQRAYVFSDDCLDITLSPASVNLLSNAFSSDHQLVEVFESTARAVRIIGENQFTQVRNEIMRLAAFCNPFYPRKILVFTPDCSARTVFLKDISNPNISIRTYPIDPALANSTFMAKLEKAQNDLRALHYFASLVLKSATTSLSESERKYLYDIHKTLNDQQINDHFAELESYFSDHEFSVELSNLKTTKSFAKSALIRITVQLPVNYEQILINYKQKIEQLLISRPLCLDQSQIVDDSVDDAFYFGTINGSTEFKTKLVDQGFSSILHKLSVSTDHGFCKTQAILRARTEHYPNFFNVLNAQLESDPNREKLQNCLASIFHLNINGHSILTSFALSPPHLELDIQEARRYNQS